MDKLTQLEVLINTKLKGKNTQKQLQIKQIDPLKYQKISDLINDLEVDDIMKYIKRLYYYFEGYEYNRYLEVIQRMKPDVFI